jgi:hypothetical protein
VIRNDVVVPGVLALLGALVSMTSMTACKSDSGTPHAAAGTHPACAAGAECDEKCMADCASSSGRVGPDGSSSGASSGGINGARDGTETDVDCGGDSAPKCAEGKSCQVDSDCEVACNYAKKCVGAPSCTPHLGGDTCGEGEVDQPGYQGESCCRTLPVTGFTDPNHPDKIVYLDKYEITAGRVRAFIERVAAQNGGVPDVKGWIAAHRPEIWDPAWDDFLPSDYEGGTITIGRRLLGDPRPEDDNDPGPPGPGVILPPPTDEVRNLGVNYQFGSEIYVDLHGNNCGTYDGSYGFPTYWYPPELLSRDDQLPRAEGVTFSGAKVSAKDLLDVKSMNCITNAMLAAFCAWDGGQLATDEVLDYVTETPTSLGNISGCGTQYDSHGNLLGNSLSGTVQTGGRCAPVSLVNATFDAGDNLPVPDSPLNIHNYHYPDTGNVTHDKSWQIAAPGRASLAAGANGRQADVVRLNPGDEPWMDLNGNVNEAALDMSGATFTGYFALKYRGVGYGSSRSDLNMTMIKGESLLRIQRPEAKAAYTGGRCMRFR